MIESLKLKCVDLTGFTSLIFERKIMDSLVDKSAPVVSLSVIEANVPQSWL